MVGSTMQEKQRETLESLRTIRAPKLDHAQDITRYLIPYGGLYIPSDIDRGADRYQDIVDETGVHALDVYEAGMMSLRTSPARPWFRWQTPDPDLNKWQPVQLWFRRAEMLAREIFRRGNTNLALPHLYREGGAFGTSATIMQEHPDNVLHHRMLTYGEYMIATDRWGRVNTLYREFVMRVAALVEEFGLNRCSERVKQLYKDSKYHEEITVIHAIEPRSFRDVTKRDVRNKPFGSYYFEKDGDNPDRYLRESGYDEFPCLVPRHAVRGGDIWGEGLGTKALGSIRQLQAEQLAKANAIEHQSDPVVQVPSSMRGRDRDLLPGGAIPHDQTSPHGGIRNAFDVPLRIDYMQLDIEDVRRRIEKSFHVSLFQPLNALNDAVERTKAEVLQRREEMLTVLAPITMRLHDEQDEPLLNRVFSDMLRRDMLPPMPRELDGQDLEVEYMGPLAQALKAVDANNMDRVIAHMGELAALKPEVVDRYDADRDLEIYTDQLGVNPELIVPGKKAALIRKARADQQSAIAAAEANAMQAKTARDLAAADTQGQNALTDALSGVTGVG